MRLSYPLSGDVSIAKWTHLIKETLGIVRAKSIDNCIYEVPKELQKVNEDAYRPHIVSIGPLHEGDHDLQAMDEHKWRYMLHLLQRNPEQEKTLNECSMAIFSLEAKARGSYAKTIKFNTYELAEILLVDGCFIIELLRFSGMHFEDDSDLIFHNDWMIPTLRHDLGLLESQIPFFVLEHLLEICVPHNLELHTTQVSIHKIADLALYFFQVKMSGEASRRI
ncbi:hypothetical protein L1049_007342 [Liquidambar formosana]|uniref:Uncharacterized protein n=1 Tax=Liquidambar formosana TaxID=63359 RepID=A0AAP0R2Q7_LIQFO